MEIIDGYPDYMRESIAKVEKTRSERIKKGPEPMSMTDREEVKSKFHPDFKLEGKRQCKIGPSQEERMPHEVVDQLEAHPLVQPGDVDLSKIDFDVDIMIIGAGGAGTVAALWAIYEGTKPENILLITKLRHGDSNSIMAQGGIQAADRPEDSPTIHFLDAYGGGWFKNKPELVKALTNDGPIIMKWHEKLGMMYDRRQDGNFVEIHGGGTSKKRMHSAKDYTGMELMRVLRDEFRNLEIPVLEFAPIVELLSNDSGDCAGGVAMNLETSEYSVIRAKSTILATGGFGRLHIQKFPTTNHYGATADGLVLAYHLGANLRDMDSVQYHPTGAVFPEPLVGLLCTEKIRGMGAMPVNCNGEAFVYALEPRDIEASAFIRECYGKNLGVKTPSGLHGIWLDTPMIEEMHGEGAIKKDLSAMFRQFHRFGVDMTRDPILVFPTLHYQNGGVEINETAETAVKGLFAGGEVAGGIHGKNRLMGNSLLDYNVFGRRAGINAAKRAQKVKPGKLSLEHVNRYNKWLKDGGIVTERKAPMILPDYRGEEALSRLLDIQY
jgi:succinate dehydrogenase / fumarate reductase flavoprotein subunit